MNTCTYTCTCTDPLLGTLVLMPCMQLSSSNILPNISQIRDKSFKIIVISNISMGGKYDSSDLHGCCYQISWSEIFPSYSKKDIYIKQRLPGWKRMTTLVEAGKKAMVPRTTTACNCSKIKHFKTHCSRCSTIAEGHAVLLLSAKNHILRLQWGRDHRTWIRLGDFILFFLLL